MAATSIIVERRARALSSIRDELKIIHDRLGLKYEEPNPVAASDPRYADMVRMEAWAIQLKQVAAMLKSTKKKKGKGDDRDAEEKLDQEPASV